VCDDSFYFVFVFPVNEVRGWSGEVWAMCSGFVIGSQQGHVKYVMNSPACGQFETVSYWGYFLGDSEWAEAFRG